jgi:glutathione-regulated potassium-efflux system ancillary protein KefG
MARVLILFAHPALEKSRVHARISRNLRRINGLTFHDLYEAYPDFDVDIKKEQALLLQHDLVILQHPFYWYSAPALVKQWLDLVLEHGWAYGTGGTMLAGKKMMNAISCGGPAMAYRKGGRNRFSIPDFLAPFDQTAVLCGMQYLPPFVIHGTHKLGPADIETYALQYEQLLEDLVADRIPTGSITQATYLNDLYPFGERNQS